MSLELHELSEVDYNALRYEIIANIEGDKKYAYIDSEGYVTIGAGFNLHEDFVRDLVLDQLFGIRGNDHREMHQ
ncbi:hypothetical protein [Teredinibacter turnerae]|uniref:hypothetical protein n=1 Tax=Teredinibacter turnerae TaxID=2426 RepID=UPI00035E00FD|nr:hypothetical protein [Teredinibacter turnerae]